ncbi:MAG TPA: hypothetical protein VFC63_09000 [Blastocatellia bacterium]|nr:hypothetical protein [Blastocatellia bacterium]
MALVYLTCRKPTFLCLFCIGGKSMANQKCAHPGCNCQINPGQAINREGEMFCSNQCADLGMSRQGNCNCGHPNCK